MECSHKEADTRLALHAYHASQSGYRKILIRTVDTDVVVLAVPRVQDLALVFGTDKYLPIHSIAEQLGPQRSKALPMFHPCQSLDATQYLSFPEGEKRLPGTRGTCFHKSQIPFQCWL